MFEVLVYMFENYIDTQFRPDQPTLSKELFAAGFDENDINGAFSWFSQLEFLSSDASASHFSNNASTRIFTELELKKITGQAIGFVLFLEQTQILNTQQREFIFELAMNLPQLSITVEEMRWIVLMMTWSGRKKGHDKTKDYLFIEDALLNREHLTVH